jgi:hypothetical protein
MTLELVIQIRVGKAARGPVLRGNDVAWAYLEIVMERATPGAFGKRLPLGSPQLIGRWVLPVDVVTRFPTMMRNVIDRDFCFPCRPDDGAKVIAYCSPARCP